HVTGIAQRDWSSPVLAEKVDVSEVERLDELPLHFDVAVDDVPIVVGDLVATAEADVVGGDHAKPRIDQRSDPSSVQVRPRRLTMDEEKRFGVASAFVDVVDAQSVDVDVVRLERPLREGVE